MKCLRDRLTGDELLLWTVETFTMFYEKTWAQRSIIPIIGLGPLILSIFSFVYDNYSDIELATEYYDHGYSNDYLSGSSNNTLCQNAYNTNQEISTENQLLFNTTSESICDEATTTRKPSLLYATGQQNCTDITRTPSEYRTAFITNIVCMCSAMLVSYVMCVRELLHHSFNYMKRHRWEQCISEGLFTFVKLAVGGVCVFPIGLILAPFFILYIGSIP